MYMIGGGLNTFQIGINYEEIENRLQVIEKEIDSNNSMFSSLLRVPQKGLSEGRSAACYNILSR